MKPHSKICQFICLAKIIQLGTMGRSYCMKTSSLIGASPRATYDSELWRIASLCYYEVTLELTMWRFEYSIPAYSISSRQTISSEIFVTGKVPTMNCGWLVSVSAQIGCYQRPSQIKFIHSSMKKLCGRMSFCLAAPRNEKIRRINMLKNCGSTNEWLL